MHERSRQKFDYPAPVLSVAYRPTVMTWLHQPAVLGSVVEKEVPDIKVGLKVAVITPNRLVIIAKWITIKPCCAHSPI
ncbi:MAG: hypothetical protein ACK52L_02640, partial [Pirellula sp.]